jgi:hypothetical protein
VPEAGAVIDGGVMSVLGSMTDPGAGVLKVAGPSGGLPGDGLAGFIYGEGDEDGCETAGDEGAAAAHDAHEVPQPAPSHAGDAHASHAAQPPIPQLPQDEHEGQLGHAGAKQADVAQAGQVEQAGAPQQAGPGGA